MRFTRRKRYQLGCLYRERRRSGPDVWVLRWRDGGVNRKEGIGTVEDFKTKSEAMKGCEFLRANINRETRAPRVVSELVSHYSETELRRKAHSTQVNHGSCINMWILPAWKDHRLSDVHTVDVEAWLGTVPLANASRAKIRNIMHAIFTHAMRYEWMNRNPITLVRCSAKRERLPDVLTADEVSALLAELRDPCRTAVLLAVSTGLRVSELLALKWSDFDFDKGEIHPSRAIVDQIVGGLKTEASGKAVPMDTALGRAMLDWRGRCPFNQDSDYVFGSPDKKGTQPYWPDSLLRKVIRPAAIRAGVSKHVGWHSFRRTLATLLQANGASVKATQDMLRHANSRLTLDLYAQSIPADRREAQARVTSAVMHSFPSVPMVSS